MKPRTLKKIKLQTTNYKLQTICFVFFVLLVTGYWLLVTPLSPVYAIDLQTPIGELKTLNVCTDTGSSITCNGLSQYVLAAYKWLIGAVGILVMVVFAWAGVLWLIAGGDSKQVSQAQKLLRDGLVGLVLTLGSYVILWTINPNLVKLNPLIIGKIQPLEFEYDPEIMREGISASGDVLNYNKMPCPTLAEAKNGFSALFTTYYKPIFPDKGGFEDFWCNLAMQCSCKKESRVCSHGLRACEPFDTTKTDYCTGGPGGAVTAGSSLAVDTNCFFVNDYSRTNKSSLVNQYWDKNMPKVEKYKNLNTGKPGLEKCKFQIDGIPGKIFTAQDTGNAIWGRHFDYFAGTNLSSGISGVRIVKVLNPEDCLVPQ